MYLARESADYRHLGGFVSVFDFYQAHSMKVLSLFVLKYYVAILIGFKPFEKLKWLDCFLPGGAIMSPRLPEASKYMVSISWLYFAGHTLLTRLLGREYMFFCAEYFRFQHKQLIALLSTGRLTELGSDTHPALRDHFVSRLDDVRLIPRPSRSAKLRVVSAYLHLMSLALMVSIVSIFIAGFAIMMRPLLLTRRGFEITRKNCVSYIMQQSATLSANELGAAQAPYDFIYRPDPRESFEKLYTNRTIPVVLAHVDLVPMNFYHIQRALTTGLEQLLGFVIYAILYWFHFYYTIGFTMELFVYARHLRKRLNKLDREMRNNQLRVHCAIEHEGPLKVDLARPAGEIDQIQASLLDYFNMLAYYNRFISLSLLLNLTLWLVYTFLFFARTLRVDRLRTFQVLDHGAQVEFLATFVATLIMVTPTLICAPVLSSEVSQLYRTLASVQALDPGASVSRKRWTKLMLFFEPRQLHCYTLFQHAGLSWLFCLKLFWWVISALVILANF